MSGEAVSLDAADALPGNGSGATRGESAPRHLFFKGIAGLLLGFPLSLWISWLLMYGGLGPVFAPARDQVSMWLVVPLWCVFLSVGFLASTRMRCIAWFVVANVLTAGAWWVMQ